MTITFPDLPEGYRWYYGPSRYSDSPHVRLEKKHFWGWKSVDFEYTIQYMFSSEQEAVNYATDKLVRKLPKEKVGNPNFGVYYGKSKGDY